MSPRTERDAARQSSRARDASLPDRSEGQRRAYGGRHVDVTTATDRDARGARADPTERPRARALTIEVNGRPVATLLGTPDAPGELAVGWAFAHGYFDERRQLQRVSCHPDRVALMIDGSSAGGLAWNERLASSVDADGHRVVDPTNGIGPQPPGEATNDGWRVAPQRLKTVVDDVFARFGDEGGQDGFHQAAIGDDRRVWAIARDISRPNAVDKIVGWTLLEERARAHAILFLSGRINADIVFKTWRAGIPIVASPSLPTREAVSLAESRRITVVGCALDARRTIFTHLWRLTE